MKKIIVISALIAGMACGTFAHAYAEDNVTAGYNNGVLTVRGLEGKARVL